MLTRSRKASSTSRCSQLPKLIDVMAGGRLKTVPMVTCLQPEKSTERKQGSDQKFASEKSKLPERSRLCKETVSVRCSHSHKLAFAQLTTTLTKLCKSDGVYASQERRRVRTAASAPWRAPREGRQ